MDVRRAADGAEFLQLTESLLAREPVLTNVIGSIAAGVAAGRTYDEAFWWVVRDERDEVVGCAVRTAPWKLVVSPMPEAAAFALGTAAAESDPSLPGATGPAEVIEAVRAGLAAAGRPTQPRPAMDDVVHVLDEYRPPAAVAGQARRADEGDLDELVEWQRAFAAEAGVPSHDPAASVASRLRSAGIWWWEVDGRPVSMAGHALPVRTPAGDVSRVGPVYTPPAHRRHGYGAAVTATVVEHLLPTSAVVMLYADAANPTSNALYERLGFRAVGRVVDVDLVAAEG